MVRRGRAWVCLLTGSRGVIDGARQGGIWSNGQLRKDSSGMRGLSLRRGNEVDMKTRYRYYRGQ